MPWSVYTFSVTKFRPGDEISALASVIFTNPPQGAINLSRIGALNRAGNQGAREISDSTDEALVRRLCIAHQYEHENHPHKGNQARDNHERVEQMRPRRNTRIGEMARQFENDNCAEGGSRTAQAADGRHGLVFVKVRR